MKETRLFFWEVIRFRVPLLHLRPSLIFCRKLTFVRRTPERKLEQCICILTGVPIYVYYIDNAMV